DEEKEERSLKLLHDAISAALKTGEQVFLPRAIVLPSDPAVPLSRAKVQVHVLQGNELGFMLPGRTRPIYEWTDTVEEDGVAVIKIYVTKGFIDQVDATVLAQALAHPLVERMGGLTHLEAVQQESYYHSEAGPRENAQTGSAILSDLTRWIIHERYHDRDWEFLHQMTEPWRLDWDRYGNIIESAEKSRAYGLSMLVTDEVMSVIGDDEEMINTILMNVTQRHMLLNFLVKILRRVEEGEYNPDLLTSIMNNPVFDTSMIRSIAGVLSVDEDIRVQLIKDYENRLADQLRDKRISVSLSGQIEFATRTDDANHLDLLDALEEYPQWLQDKRDMLIQKANRRPQWFHRMLLWFSGDYPFMKGLITSEQILRLPIRIVRGLEARPIQLVDGKLELSAASLQNGREDLYRTLLAQSVKTISSRLKTRPEKRVEVQKLIRDRLHQIKEGDLVPLDSSVLSIIGGEERLRGWFQQVKDQLPKDVTYDFANIERVLNTGRVFFVMPEVGSLGLVSSPDAFLTPLMTGHIVQATDIEGLEGAIIQEGDILIDYGVIDVLLTRADLTENKQERNAYWLSAFSILLEFVHQTESGRADPSITQQIQDALPVPESWDPYSVAYILGGIENRHKEYYRAIQQFTEQLGSIQLDGLDGYDAVRIDWTRAALIFERDNEVLATFQLESPLAINTIFESLNQVGIQGVRFIIHQPGDLSPLVKWFHKIALGVAFNNISEGVAASQVLMGLNGDVVLISRTRDGIDIDPSPENILDIAPNVAPTRAQPESREALRALASSA
ncbi:MAG: hypothetical protein Q8Q33_01950, partial [Chlamydiota bacterium]|nr:hypothetical protein [Chlamydiota bacterium]